MNPAVRNKLYDFYSKELKENILGFWLPRCEDRQSGGYLNCLFLTAGSMDSVFCPAGFHIAVGDFLHIAVESFALIRIV